MKKAENTNKRSLGVFILIMIILLFFVSCEKIPEKDDFSVSKLIDFKLAGYKADKYEFSDVSDFLDNESLEGNMISIHYSSETNGQTTIIAAKTAKTKGVYYLWRHFAKENNALFKASFSSIPFLLGEFSQQKDDTYVYSWFKDKWFFLIETKTEDELKTTRTLLTDFFENAKVINESVIDL